MQGKKLDYNSEYYVNEMKERLKKKMNINDNQCWIWTGCLLHGYGIIRARGRNYSAHRLSFELFKGINPGKNFLCHKCDNPSCINPDHLFQGNQHDNMQDAVEKKRMKYGSNHYLSKLTELDLKEIKELLKIGFTQKRISEIFKVDPSSISKINSGKTWKNLNKVNF